MSTSRDDGIEFTTSDGVTVVGDLVTPDHAVGAAIVCHPHPSYGGNRFHPVVDAIFSSLPGVGFAALRFDFRDEFGHGVTEARDAAGALDELARRLPGVPLLASGYSFGAMVALALTDRRIDGRVLVAPPLGAATPAPTLDRPTLVLTPARDQFAPPEQVTDRIAAWPDTDFGVIEMTDHFLVGRAAAVADRAVAWISARWPPRSLP